MQKTSRGIFMKNTYADLIHSERGLFKGYDLQKLRAKINKSPFKIMFSNLQKAVKKTAQIDAQKKDIESFGWCHSLYFTPMVMEAGFLYAITGESFAAEHVSRQIDKLARVYADPPASFEREIKNLNPRQPKSAYFSNAHTCLAAQMCRTGLSTSTINKLLELIRTHFINDSGKPEYFFTHFNAAHNTVVTHAISAAICALIFGKESKHPRWEKAVELGRDACEMHLKWGFDENGVPYEGPMYALVTLEWVFLFADLLQRHGGENLFKTFARKINTILNAQFEMQVPQFKGFFGFNDCRHLIQGHPMTWLMLTASIYGRQQDAFLWHHSKRHGAWHAKEAEKAGFKVPPLTDPANKSNLFELLWWNGKKSKKFPENIRSKLVHTGKGAGVVTWRTSWKRNAVCINILAQGRSHNVPDHTHADAGHFSIIAHDELLAYDTAYFNFDEDTHSTILIDNKVAHPAIYGNLFHGYFEKIDYTRHLDYFKIDYTAARGCMWAFRHFLLVRGENDLCYMVIMDNINVDNGVHNFTWQLQANMHTAIFVNKNTAVIKGKKSALDCHFFNPLPQDYPTAPHSLKVFADNHKHLNIWTKTPETNPRLVAEQTGPNCTLMSLIIPRRLSDKPLKVHYTPYPRIFAITVKHNNYKDLIIWGCDHSWIRLPDVHSQSEITFIRYRNNKIIKTWTPENERVIIKKQI